MDELEDMLMEHGIMKPVDEAIVGKTAAELAAESGRAVGLKPSTAGPSREGPDLPPIFEMQANGRQNGNVGAGCDSRGVA